MSLFLKLVRIPKIDIKYSTPEPRKEIAQQSCLLPCCNNLSFLKLSLSGYVLRGPTLRTTYATAKGAHCFCGQKTQQRPWDGNELQQGPRGSSSAEDCLEAKGSLFLLAMLSCQSLLIAAPSLWMPPTSASPPGRIPSSTSTCQHLFLSPLHLTQFGKSCLAAKGERFLCRTSLCETPDASQNTSSFLISTSQGYYQIQSNLAHRGYL